eukprot:scaffold148575_cov23-Cyclotella_meneghiniana.AAC.1
MRPRIHTMWHTTNATRDVGTLPIPPRNIATLKKLNYPYSPPTIHAYSRPRRNWRPDREAARVIPVYSPRGNRITIRRDYAPACPLRGRPPRKVWMPICPIICPR